MDYIEGTVQVVPRSKLLGYLGFTYELVAGGFGGNLDGSGFEGEPLATREEAEAHLLQEAWWMEEETSET